MMGTREVVILSEKSYLSIGVSSISSILGEFSELASLELDSELSDGGGVWEGEIVSFYFLEPRGGVSSKDSIFFPLAPFYAFG